MIQSKEDLRDYLNRDKIALGRSYNIPNRDRAVRDREYRAAA